MRKLFFLCLFVLAVFVGCGQTNHLKFMGVSMNYTLNTFVSYMQQKGFSKTNSDGYVCHMKGRFAGEQVELQIYATSSTKYVNTVLVIFDEYSGVTYSGMKSRLLDKYDMFYTMDFDDTEPDDGFVKNSVKHCLIKTDCNENDECNYIILSLAKEYSFSSEAKKVIISYVDRLNMLKGEKENDDDL